MSAFMLDTAQRRKGVYVLSVLDGAYCGKQHTAQHEAVVRKRPKKAALSVQTAEIGRNIDEARKRLAISKSELARRTGFGLRTIQAWIRGEQEPKGTHVRKLAEVLHVTTDDLLRVLDGQDPPFAAWRPFLSTPEGQSMTAAELRAVKRFDWPDEPTLAKYKALLFAIRL
jgi:transcriptional regulator with XRE-family HTH domain